MNPRGRYAPSPTGRLHLGNARSALLSWLVTRAASGRYVMRIEDLDRGRSRDAFESLLLTDLRWLGIDWDEGPDVGGAFGPYRQSERSELYASAAQRLATFACTCTRREVREATLAPHGREPIYPGTCRSGSTNPDRPHALRWCVPPGRVDVDDLVLGALAQDVAAEVGDFVLRRADGAWAYQLAVVVDDAQMEINEVVRGADLTGSTARQVLLQRALGLPTPRYAHVPLVLGADGEKLSKRHGAPDLCALREDGVEAGRVVAMLARSVGLLSPGVMSVQATELVADFELSRVKAQPLDLGMLSGG